MDGLTQIDFNDTCSEIEAAILGWIVRTRHLSSQYADDYNRKLKKVFWEIPLSRLVWVNDLLIDHGISTKIFPSRTYPSTHAAIAIYLVNHHPGCTKKNL